MRAVVDKEDTHTHGCTNLTKSDTSIIFLCAPNGCIHARTHTLSHYPVLKVQFPITQPSTVSTSAAASTAAAAATTSTTSHWDREIDTFISTMAGTRAHACVCVCPISENCDRAIFTRVLGVKAAASGGRRPKILLYCVHVLGFVCVTSRTMRIN